MYIYQSTTTQTAFYPAKMLNCEFMQYAPRVQACVYVLALHGGRFKIGMTKNLHQRVRDYTTIQPDIKIVAAIFLDSIIQAEQLESQMLTHLDRYRVGGSEVVEIETQPLEQYIATITATKIKAIEVKNHSQLLEYK